jgi:hypothetical protein
MGRKRGYAFNFFVIMLMRILVEKFIIREYMDAFLR